MPKHLLLFAVFLALLTAIFYHPIPNPDLWDASSPSWATPKVHPQASKPLTSPTWPKELKASLDQTSSSETLSSIH